MRAEPDRLTRGLWDGLAAVLVGKRDVEGIWEWVEPLTGVWEDWFEGEVALAHADLESINLDAAAERVAALTAPARPAALARWRDVRIALARAYRDAGRTAEVQALADGLDHGRSVERRPVGKTPTTVARGGSWALTPLGTGNRF